MQTFAHYALLGSLIAAAAGVLVLTAVTVKYGIRRRALLDGDDEGDAAELSRRQRTVRLADTMVVVCFAVAAGLGVVGMTRPARVATVLPGDDAAPPPASPRLAPPSASPRLAPRDEGGVAPDVKQEASAPPPLPPRPTVTPPPPPMATAPPPPPIVAVPPVAQREAPKPRAQAP